ncbi:hypothetical protein BGS_0003 [Beggiatoa sp. SS]|nr:hypothetical protein BGS_0003 [Beggiatoa sp. SS]
MNIMKIIDLFAGIGGLSLGFQKCRLLKLEHPLVTGQRGMEIPQPNFNPEAPF